VAQCDRFYAPEKGLALCIEAKWTERTTSRKCSALLIGTFRNFSQHLHDSPVSNCQSAPNEGSDCVVTGTCHRSRNLSIRAAKSMALVRGMGKEPAMVLPILTGIIGAVSRSHAP